MTSFDASHPVTDADWHRCEAVLDAFENAWQNGTAPILENYLLPVDDPARQHLLVELIKIDLESRWARGECPGVDHYLGRFPELSDSGQTLRELIQTELRVRRSDGGKSDNAELTHPFANLESGAGDQRGSGIVTHTATASDNPAQAAVARPSVGVPHRLGRYELREVLGRGGFATVYRAWDPELRRDVAIKSFREEFAGQPELMGRVQREARSAAQLRHPAIVPVYEVGQHGSNTFIVYEFIAGRTLADLVRDTTPSPRQAAEWVARLAEALDYAHQCGIVHRDVKPANVLMEMVERGAWSVENQNETSHNRLPPSLDPQRLTLHPRITDFGLALQVDAGATITQEGDLLGTPAYMPPEQAKGRGHTADARSDVYGLGVVLYELLCGRPPFEGSGPSILHRVIHEEPQPPRSVRAGLPIDVETICLKAMAKEPERRYQSAGAMAEDLRRYLSDEPILARRVGPIGRLVRWCRRRPAVTATLVASAILCLVVVGVSFHRVVRERDRARLISAGLALDRAQVLGEQGEAGQALLWLARGLQLAPADAAELRGAIRANLGAWRHQVGSPQMLMEHRDQVLAVAVSPDVRAILTGSKDRSARLWNAKTGQPLSDPLEHDEAVRAVAFSGDGSIALTGSSDGMARFWDTATGQPTGRPLKHGFAVTAVALSPDSQAALTGCTDGTVRRWVRQAGETVGKPLQHEQSVMAVSFSPDGHRVITASRDWTVRRWDAATGDALGQPHRLRSLPRTVVFSADARSALIGYDDNSLWILDLSSDEPGETLLQQRGLVTCGAFSADGRLILTGSSDRTVRLWDGQTRSPLGAPLRHPDLVMAVAFGPGDSTAVTASQDGYARVWQLPGGGPIAGHVLRHDDPVWALAFSPDGRRLFTGCGWREQSGVARLWDVETGKPLGPTLPVGSQTYAVAVSPDGQTLVTGSQLNLVQRWSAATGKSIGPPLEHKSAVTLTAFSPDGKTIMTASFALSEHSPLFWDVATGERLDRRLEHGHVVRSAVWSRDGRLIVTGGGDGAAKLWDAACGRLLMPPMQHQGQVGAVVLSNDNRYVLVGTDANLAQLWDTTTGLPIGPPLEHQGTVRGVAFSPDGRLMATASWDMSARLWDRATGKPVGPPLKHGGELEAVAFSPDGQWVVTASWDKTVRFWKVPRPMDGSVDAIRLWAEVSTGMEFDSAGAVRLLDATAWQARHRAATRSDTGRN